MKLGLQVSSFTWPGGDAAIGPTLARVAETADAVGFDSLWVMDHFYQIRGVGRPQEPMLEGWTALAYMAAHSKKASLGLMVGGVGVVAGSVVGGFIMGVMNNGMSILGIGIDYQQVIKGLVLLAAVFVDVYNKSKT